MFVDLLMLTVIGCVLEFLCARYGALVLNATPFTYVSFLIAFLAVVRWRLWGLLTIPILNIANYLAGQNLELTYLISVYDWRFYLSATVGMLSIGINVLFFKKNTKSVINSTLKLLGVMFVDYIIMNAIQLIVYRMLTSGDILKVGVEIIEVHGVEGGINICKMGEAGFVYNLFSFGVLIVGTLVLRSQGIVCDRTQRFIDDKLNAELDRIDAETFTIQEAEESEAKDVSNSNLG